MNEEYPSPDNRYLLQLGCSEMRMSHWVCSPTLKDTQDGSILFSAGSLWDAGAIKWSDDSRTLWLSMRKYPGNAADNYGVVIHLEDRIAEVTREGKEKMTVQLNQLSGIFSGA